MTETTTATTTTTTEVLSHALPGAVQFLDWTALVFEEAPGCQLLATSEEKQMAISK